MRSARSCARIPRSARASSPTSTPGRTCGSIVRHHHEQFSGGGYPDGLRYAEIPLGARIVSVVDAFDVMRTGRPYQAARSTEWSLDELRRESGRQFDPEIVRALLAVLPADGSALEAPPLDLDLCPTAERSSAAGRRTSRSRRGSGEAPASMVRVPRRLS